MEHILEQEDIMKERNGMGSVDLVEVHGGEAFIKQVSGQSHDSAGASVAKLLEWGHLSPLEFAGATFKVKCPIFVARQIMRHRTGKFMELSLRYCDSELEFYTPKEIEGDAAYSATLTNCEVAYIRLLKKHGKGRGNELARNILPVCTYTMFYMQMDIRNLMHFLVLRLSDDTQEETRDIASQMLDLIEEQFPTIAKYVKEQIKAK